jgi:uncharacterized protein YlbG (UPF0298 family)
MARIRTIKPSFFKNEDLAELQFTVRLFYIGLWTQADREGKLEYRPKRLKSEIFPYDNINVDDMLDRLQSAGFINRYEVGELKVIAITNFLKHQCPNVREPKSDIPDEYDTSTILEYYCMLGREGKGKEGKAPKLISELKMEDCKLKPDTLDFRIIETSFKLFAGFKKSFPLNKDLDLIEMKEWVPYVRVLIEEKKYTYDNIRDVLNWAMEDKFWKTVIIDAKSLEKNFEKLKIQYQDV